MLVTYFCNAYFRDVKPMARERFLMAREQILINISGIEIFLCKRHCHMYENNMAREKKITFIMYLRCLYHLLCRSFLQIVLLIMFTMS